MGTAIQRDRPDEAGYRGERFADWPTDVQGNNDLLSITAPEIIAGIHREYLEAGADLIETNTFNATAISLSRLRHGGARLRAQRRLGPARPRGVRRDDRAHARTSRATSSARSARPAGRRPSRPTSTTPAPATSPSTSWSRPTCEQANGLVDGGADVLLVETIFDTLNAKAAIFALETLFEERGRRWPVMISGTITDASGRTLSGQVTEAFWHSVRHVQPAAGRPQLRARRQGDAALHRRARPASPTRSSPAIRTPACPTRSASTTSRPRRPPRSSRSSPTAASSTSSAAAAARRRRTSPRSPPPSRARPRARRPRRRPALRLSGLEPVTVTDDTLFVNVGERTNITGSARFRNLIKAGDYPAALAVARQQVEAGAQVIDINMDEGMIDGVEAMDRFTKLIATEPDICRVPDDDRLLEVGGHRGRPQVRPGQGDRQLDLPEGGRGEVRPRGAAVPQVRRRRRRHGLRRGRARPTTSSAARRSAGGPTTSSPSRSASRPRTSSSTRTSSPSPRASRSTPTTGWTSSRPPAGSSRTCPARWSPAASRTSRSPSAATTRCARPSTRSSCTTRSRPGMDMGIVNAGAARGLRRGAARCCASASRT